MADLRTRCRNILCIIRKHWKDGMYTELHWHGTYVAKHPILTPAQADDDETLIGVYDGSAVVQDLVDDIQCAMRVEQTEAV